MFWSKMIKCQVSEFPANSKTTVLFVILPLEKQKIKLVEKQQQIISVVEVLKLCQLPEAYK